MWYELGQRLVELTDSKIARFSFAFVLASTASLLDLAVRSVSERVGQPGLDSLAVGAFVFCLTYIEVRAVNARRHRLLGEVVKVAELNHVVRNALQSIRYAAHLGAEAEYVKVIDSSVERIDSVLRSLFPIVIDSRKKSSID